MNGLQGASVHLSVFDLVPIVEGGTAGEALRRSIDLARVADGLGYRRYWVAEHHFTPGVACASPALLLGQLACVTERIRLGSGAVLSGHQTPVSVLEQFGLLDALYPGRFDLGLGRSGQRRQPLESTGAATRESRVVDGLLVPRPFVPSPSTPRGHLRMIAEMLHQPGAVSPPFTDFLDELQALISGPVSDAEGNQVTIMPGKKAELDVWLLGMGAGESARVAGERGLPFCAGYHAAPGGALDAIDTYRTAFRPSGRLTRPYVMVSAEVLVGPDEASAEEIAAPFAVWVRAIRAEATSVPFPSPRSAARHEWNPEDREAVADRVATRFVGSARTVVEGLRTLQRVTGADELLISTLTYEHADRVRSYELLAKQW